VAARLRGWPRSEVLAAILALGSCWMILCGPATESPTYVLLAPAMAWAVLAAENDGWPWFAGWMVRVGFLLLMLCVIRGLWRDVNRFHALGLQPQAALLLSLAYGVVLTRRLMTARRQPAETSGIPARAA
jgi:hypothetical protein